MHSPDYELDSPKFYSTSHSSDTLLPDEGERRPARAARRWSTTEVLMITILGHLALCAINYAFDSFFWHLSSFGDHGNAWGSRVALFRAANWPVLNTNGTALGSKQRPTLLVDNLYMRGATHGYETFPHAPAGVRNADPNTVFIIDGSRPTSKLSEVYKRDGRPLSISARGLREHLRAMVWVTSSETLKKELRKSISHLSGTTFNFLTVGWVFGGLIQAIGGVAIRWHYDAVEIRAQWTQWTQWAQWALESLLRFLVVVAVVLPGCPWWLTPGIVVVAQGLITFAWPVGRKCISVALERVKPVRRVSGAAADPAQWPRTY
ncbi:hypothetical protein AURDEDRAFT_164033 [Auricularia subglabra TFB-10046 SS5]|nr:hypothetical protein AURDEDRAFT_164033 [Auricularia subglabra TFB-10046 SS5]